jgi:nucleolin
MDRVMDTDLTVRNLETSITTEELRGLFAQAGEVSSIRLPDGIRERTSRGFAYITMTSQNEADRAVNMFDSFILKGQPLHVSLTFPRKQRGL